MQLTKHFALSELIVSQTAARRGLDNTPSATVKANLKLLCEKILEPVRVHFGKPVIVTSGFRAPAVNRAVGGRGTSQHCFGQAADFSVVGVSNLEVCLWIQKNLKFDQLILEFPPAGWVHCSFSDKQQRQQTLTIKTVRGKTATLPGLQP